MKKITLLFIFCIAFGTMSYAQCTTDTGGQWPGSAVALANSGAVETIATNNWPNAEFSIIENVLPGSDYTVAGTPSLYITVTNTADDAVITHGAGSISFTAPAGVTGLTIYWHLDAACATQDSGNTLTTIQCTTCVCTATAAPNAVSNPTPTNGALDVVLVGGGTVFEWDESLTGEPAESFTISIGTTAAADEIGSLTNATSGNTITFGGADNNTYFWKIDAINCFGTTTSPVWSFSTIACPETAAPTCPTVIAPVDGEMSATTTDDGTGTGSVNISWNPIAGVSSYQITFDGNVLGNTGLTSINITGLALSTAYTWSIEPINCFGTATGCTTWSFTTGAALSVEENTLETFSVYPNPTSDILNIKTIKDIDNVTVFNLLGQSVASFKKNDIIDSSINLSELSKGLYLVKISSGDTTQTIRVTKN